MARKMKKVSEGMQVVDEKLGEEIVEDFVAGAPDDPRAASDREQDESLAARRAARDAKLGAAAKALSSGRDESAPESPPPPTSARGGRAKKKPARIAGKKVPPLTEVMRGADLAAAARLAGRARDKSGRRPAYAHTLIERGADGLHVVCSDGDLTSGALVRGATGVPGDGCLVDPSRLVAIGRRAGAEPGRLRAPGHVAKAQHLQQIAHSPLFVSNLTCSPWV